jgi:hypothetical protein
MHPARLCPECGHEARWVATAIECDRGNDHDELVETHTYYCPHCGKFWDVQTTESGVTRVRQVVGEASIGWRDMLQPMTT